MVNPIGMIAAAAQMLRLSFGLEAEAGAIEEAIRQVLAANIATADIWHKGKILVGTKEMEIFMEEDCLTGWTKYPELQQSALHIRKL